jgi:hypothetical protein
MPPVVVISDRFWRTHMAADPQAVGRGLRLNGWMATIIGIGPKDFLGIWPMIWISCKRPSMLILKTLVVEPLHSCGIAKAIRFRPLTGALTAADILICDSIANVTQTSVCASMASARPPASVGGRD